MSILAGIDGCPGGWVCVVEDSARGELDALILPSIAEIIAITPMPHLVMIDIPIGLLSSGPRQCDLDARKLLGRPRSSNVFPAPLRPCLAAESYQEACAIRMKSDNRRMSRQAWGIIGKVREVDAFLLSHPAWQARLREVHPELSFQCWNSDTPMDHGKKTLSGFCERETLVRAHFKDAYERVKKSLPRGRFGRDDLMDAFAALWTAERVDHGAALAVPAVPAIDEQGLQMQILA